jgi:hypothetical protein
MHIACLLQGGSLLAMPIIQGSKLSAQLLALSAAAAADTHPTNTRTRTNERTCTAYALTHHRLGLVWLGLGRVGSQQVLKCVLACVGAAVCVSHTSRENTVLRAALPPARVYVIPNGSNGWCGVALLGVRLGLRRAN